MKTSFATLGVLLLLLAHAPAQGGWGGGAGGAGGGFVRPFQRINGPQAQRGGQGGIAQQGPGAFSVPQVMPVVRGRRNPVEVIFQTRPAELGEDATIARLDERRKSLARALRAARSQQDMAESSRLLREIESVRQQRLERIRSLSPPQVIEKKRSEDATSPVAPGAAPATEKPVLPIPTRPGGANP